MEPENLVVRNLQEIRDEVRSNRTESREDLRAVREELRASREATEQRFLTIETALRDLAEQIVILGRGVKVAIETRGRADDRIDG